MMNLITYLGAKRKIAEEEDSEKLSSLFPEEL
jgi:hypothetical protein